MAGWRKQVPLPVRDATCPSGRMLWSEGKEEFTEQYWCHQYSLSIHFVLGSLHTLYNSLPIKWRTRQILIAFYPRASAAATVWTWDNTFSSCCPAIQYSYELGFATWPPGLYFLHLWQRLWYSAHFANSFHLQRSCSFAWGLPRGLR